MLDREWVSVVDPDDPHERYVFDVSFLLSSYTCIYGRGCPGVGDEPDPVRGCCRLGAHYTDDEDRERVEAMVERLGPDYLQFYREAARHGVTATLPGGQARTRVRDGACVFANRGDWQRGPGCALHTYAVERGEHPMTYKPEVCWMVPLRREIAEDVGDDGQPVSITTITSFERGAWGPGGADFGWWCTESAEAFVGEDPVYRSMEAELRQMVGHAVYTELATYLDRRRSRARKPLPFPLYVR
ncbi:hypothetical protein BH20ACT8_BH20ACT8_04100 [soil metagenome]